MKQPKLIILRGNSGSGKTTVARKLFEDAKDGTALIEQDYYRFMFKPAGGTLNSKTIHKLILQDTLLALNDGYDVILEGILTTKSYGNVLKNLFSQHPSQNYIFYFDISLEETLRRHRGRESENHFTEEDMRGWYNDKDTTDYDFEHIISESSSLEQTLATIQKITQL